ncbi:hypothetical protein BBB56_06000 [Candidatus Pantoea deserta]|uniref:Ead/Ea22-like family protein n=1 Tax=Candidatus Pantoea deserta TaxID=1869313 RepID=A0A3N4P2U6_9GAMM|nr:hypothetical protein [Pantoea deserta]RPE02952.1 hypothetical protein BBB56_06000 [Pantoea deserta]
MNHSDIEHMAQGFPPSSIGKDHEEVVTYLATTLLAAQQKLDALAAENAALKSNLMFWDAEDPENPYDSPEDIANNCGMDFNTKFEVQVAAKMPNRTYRVSEVSQYDCKIELVSDAIPETPATDACLNSLRAEGVIMFASKQLAAASNLESTTTLERLMLDAEELAGQLRATGGKDGE